MQGAAIGNARRDIQQQLEIWQRKGLLKHMDQKLVDIYDLLAGNPEPVIDRLKLEWTQAFALYFWYGFFVGSANFSLVLMCTVNIGGHH